MIKTRGHPFNKKGVFSWCCIPVSLQPPLLTPQPQLEAFQDLPFPYQCNPALNEIRTQKSSSERDLSFQLLPGEHTCKWLNFLLAQCKFFSVEISVWCCFAAWSWQGFMAQKGQKLCQVKLQMHDPTTCHSKSLCRLIYSLFSPMMMMVAPHRVSTETPQVLQPSMYKKTKNFCYQWSRERVVQGNFADKCNSLCN